MSEEKNYPGEIDSQNRVRLPDYIMRALSLKPGEMVYFVKTEEGYLLIPGWILEPAIGLTE